MMQPGVHFQPVPWEELPEHQFDQVTGQPLVPAWKQPYARVIAHLHVHHERNPDGTADQEQLPELWQ